MSAPIVAKVYGPTNTGSPLAVLTQDRGRQWMEKLNDIGAGSLVVPLTSPDAAYLTPGNVVRFSWAGTERFAIILEDDDAETASQSDEAGEFRNAAGVGLLAMPGDSLVYPEAGIGANALYGDARWIGFMSKDYIEPVGLGWTGATEIKRVDALTGQWDHSPTGFPDQSAYWIWGQAQSGGTPPQPTGDCYFTKSFTLASASDVSFWFSFDDTGVIYLDGVPIFTEHTSDYLWREFRRINLFLTAGTHYLAVKATNTDRPGNEATNVAGFIMTVFTTTSGGVKTAFILNTDHTWRALAYPSTAPTMTPGRVMGRFLAESQARGELPGVTLSCTDSGDSAGVAWAASAGIDASYPIPATTLLTVLRQMIESGVDVRMRPNGTLDMWNRGHTRDKTAVVLTKARNETPTRSHVTSLRHRRQRPSATRVLARLADGSLVERTSSWASVYGYRSAGLSLGTAGSRDQANRTIDVLFEELAQMPDEFTFSLSPRDDQGPRPYIEFDIADTVKATNRALGLSNVRVHTFGVTEDDNGELAVVCEAR